MSVNRQAWAGLVAQLLDEETGGNKSRFARLVDVEYKTINRWLRGEVDVSEESVRKVARALGRSPIKLLIEAGYYTAEDVAGTAPLPEPEQEDLVLLAIHDAPLPPHKKVELVERIRERRARLRERQQEDELAEVTWWIQQQQRGA